MLQQRLQTLNIWRANDCSQALCLLNRLHGTIRALNHTAPGLVAREGLNTLDLRICSAKAVVLLRGKAVPLGSCHMTGTFWI